MAALSSAWNRTITITDDDDTGGVIAPHIKSRTITLPQRGVALHYIEAGAPRDPLIICVHGWPEFWYAWRHQLPVLATNGYRVIAVDMRGFGRTRLLDGNMAASISSYTYREQSRDLDALITAVSGASSSAIIIGHDWGGGVVWNMARRFPSRIAAVASLSTMYRPRAPKFTPMSELAARFPVLHYQHYFAEERRTAANELQADLSRTFKVLMRTSQRADHIGRWMTPKHKRFLEGWPASPSLGSLLSADELAYYVREYGRHPDAFFVSLAWYNTWLLNWQQDGVGEDDVTPLPTIVPQPALMVTTGKDVVLPASATNGMEQWIPQLSRAHIEESAHWVCSEQASDVNKALMKWLASLSPHITARCVSTLGPGSSVLAPPPSSLPYASHRTRAFEPLRARL